MKQVTLPVLAVILIGALAGLGGTYIDGNPTIVSEATDNTYFPGTTQDMRNCAAVLVPYPPLYPKSAACKRWVEEQIVSSTGAVWGAIIGTITNQSDLWSELTNRYTMAQVDALFTSETLATVLARGNIASTNIDMSTFDITNFIHADAVNAGSSGFRTFTYADGWPSAGEFLCYRAEGTEASPLPLDSGHNLGVNYYFGYLSNLTWGAGGGMWVQTANDWTNGDESARTVFFARGPAWGYSLMTLDGRHQRVGINAWNPAAGDPVFQVEPYNSTFTNDIVEFRTKDNVTIFEIDMDGDRRDKNDNIYQYWGANDDAAMWYDGTNFHINAAAVGTGKFVVDSDFQLQFGASVSNIGTTIIDSDADLPTMGAVVDYAAPSNAFAGISNIVDGLALASNKWDAASLLASNNLVSINFLSNYVNAVSNQLTSVDTNLQAQIYITLLRSEFDTYSNQMSQTVFSNDIQLSFSASTQEVGTVTGRPASKNSAEGWMWLRSTQGFPIDATAIWELYHHTNRLASDLTDISTNCGLYGVYTTNDAGVNTNDYWVSDGSGFKVGDRVCTVGDGTVEEFNIVTAVDGGKISVRTPTVGSYTSGVHGLVTVPSMGHFVLRDILGSNSAYVAVSFPEAAQTCDVKMRIHE